MASYGSTARLGAAWTLIRESHNEILGLVTSMVMARLLAPYDFGVATAAGFFLGLAGRLTRFGFNFALVRIKDLRPEHAASVFVVNLVIGVVMAAVFVAAGPLLGHAVRNADAGRVMMVAGLGFLLGAFGTVPSAMMARNFMFRQQTYVDWATTWTYTVLAPALALAGFGYWSIVVAQLSASAVQIASSLYLSPWKPVLRFSKAAMSDLFSFGMGIYAKRTLEYATMNLDNLVVGRALGMSALGFYDKGFSLMNRIVDRASLGAGTSFRVFALIQDQPERFRRGYRKTAATAAMVALPALAVIAVMGHEVILVLFGERWQPSVVPFQILCVAGMLRMLGRYNSAAIQAFGQIWSEVWRQVASIGALVACVWVGSAWGLPGAAAGVLAASAVMTLLMNHLLVRVTPLTWGDLVAPLVPGLVCAAGAALVTGGTRAVVATFAPHPLALAGSQAAAAALWMLAYLRWSRAEIVRELVAETIAEFGPRLRKRISG